MSEKRVRVDIWSDIACPWCFIGKRRFEKGVEQFEFSENVDVFWHAYQLDPTLPEHYDGDEVQYLSQVKGMDPQQVKGMLAHVTEQAAGEGLNYDFDALRPANSFTALRLLEHAKTEGKANEMKETLLSAHFERGLDTGERQVLAQLAAEVGLDEAAVQGTLDSQTYTEEVNADIEQARQLGISGVPFFVIDGKYGISGAQPAEAFANALAQAHAGAVG
ncbi:DsbA family protein [Glutamicibacter arilaitensis]|uniref:DsbA family oxidoreductase n=1 Tax=Glutamicibacter arilaitensis TaxID=256701 RepID=UPI0038513141